ncbi:MAG: sugar phosphate isomerase/epimerase [Pedosphaera sp.]|nr:sugar phosphate isomerase/epimerase [Pedosphaera sp.]
MKKLIALCLTAAVLISRVSAAGLIDQLAIQTWTLRNMKFDEVIAFAKKHGIRELQLIPNHIDYKKESTEEMVVKKEKLAANGLHAYTYGVAGTSIEKAENRRLFEFCKFMGFGLIVVEPGDFRIWDDLEALAIEFDIKVAVHNHGIKSLYGNPAIVKQIIQHRDRRIGVCMDIGWVTSAGFDAAKIFKEYDGRVFDLHLKDKRIEKTEGDDVYFDTHIGEGKSNLKGLFAELKKSNYAGKLAIETDSQDFAKSPDAFVTKAKEYVTAQGK